MNPNNIGQVQGLSAQAQQMPTTIRIIDDCNKHVHSIRTKISMVLRPLETDGHPKPSPNTALMSELENLLQNLVELDNAIEL